MYWSKHVLSLTVVGAMTALSGCTSHSSLPEATAHPSMTTNVNDYQYLIGPGDSLTIFVWRNPEISGQFIVRPDGKVTTSLVEDVDVAGKTPSMLARELEEQLSTFINNPRVTVSVNNFAGPLSEQVRVIGEATNPRAIDQAIADLVNFLAYSGEPFRLQSEAIGKWVLVFIIVLFIFVFLLKKEYWKEVH